MTENSKHTYKLVVFRESDGSSTVMEIVMSRCEAFELGVKLRTMGILAFFTRKGGRNYCYLAKKTHHREG